jgi:hypothetical protein
VAELFTDLIGQVTTLLRKESQLARAEVSEKIGQAAGGLVLVMIGGVMLVPALMILLGAAVTALVDAGVEPLWATLIVGGVVLLLGLILILVGTSRLKARRLVPGKTIEQLQRDASVVRQQVRHDHEQIQRAA